MTPQGLTRILVRTPVTALVLAITPVNVQYQSITSLEIVHGFFWGAAKGVFFPPENGYASLNDKIFTHYSTVS